MKTFLRENRMCVLATSSGDKPHCSLMQYVLDEGAATVYMATLNSSRKYENIVRNPRVSLLVDSRARETDPGKIKAMTVSGAASLVKGEDERAAILARIVESHPSLRELLRRPGVEVMAVRVESFLLLEGPAKATLLEAGD